MDSKEEFQFEVPIVGINDIKCGHLASKDNDCVLKFTANAVITTEANSDTELQENASIILEDLEKDCTIIENSNICINNNKHDIMSYDIIYTENKILLELIERCLDMKKSQGMLRIVNRTLIPIYNDATESYRKSVEFKKVLFDTIVKLDTEPERKFTLVRDICEILKLNKAPDAKIKKRVSFTTLQNNLNGKTSKHKFNPYSNHRHNATKRKKVSTTSLVADNAVIDCDSSDSDVEICNVAKPVLDLDRHTTVVIEDNDVIAIDDEDNHSNKENNVQVNNTPSSDLVIKNSNVDEQDDEDSSGDLLQITSHEVVNNEEKIKDIERRIGIYHKLVAQLEEQEVVHDTASSEYVLCDHYKEIVVTLYKELCKLTGTDAVKRHEVRLKVAEGHPKGPVRCLEEFINSGIDEQGNPPFPDMLDVTQCVSRANVEYNLNWNRQQILTEAQALFVHYGRAIQKRRQGREWRHLLRYIKASEVDDPADADAALQAKLEDNHAIARKREQDFLDRFAEMENPTFNCGLDVRIDNDDSADSESGDASPIIRFPKKANRNGAELRLNSYATSCNGDITNNVSLYVVSNNNVGMITEVSQRDMNRNEAQICTNTDDLVREESSFNSGVEGSNCSNGVNMTDENNQEKACDMTDKNNCVVKEEPEDVGRMLDELGDDFTTTIIDVIDPFTVIEISDSSESEDEGTFFEDFSLST